MSGPTHIAGLRLVEPELTIYQVRDLRSAWLQAYAEGARGFDLSAVTEIDGAGAQLMASLAAYGKREADPVTFSSASAVVRELLELLGAGALLDPDFEGAGHDA